MATAPDNLTLTAPQVAVLRMIVGAERAGYIHAAGDPIYVALARRGLIVAAAKFDDGRAHWIATFAGREWMLLDQQVNGGGYRPPPSVWHGTAVTGSRWTAEQLRSLDVARVDDPERVRTAIIDRKAEGMEDDWTAPARRVRVVVPRLQITRSGRRAQVVLPSGSVRWAEIVRG